MNKSILYQIILFFAFVVLLGTTSYATDSFELNLKPESSSVKKGDTVNFDIVLDNLNIESGDKGIGAFQATIKYDTNIFSGIESITSTDWEISENEGNIIANTKNGECVTSKSTVGIIQLKVADNAKEGETSVSLTGISGSSGVTISGTSVVSIVNIVNEAPSTDNPTNDNPTDSEKPSTDSPTNNNLTDSEKPNKSTNSSQQISSSTSGNSLSGKTTSSNIDKVLPKTGGNFVYFILIFVCIVCMIGVISYLKYRDYKKL